ncbi:MAG: hypothetical protein ABR860_04630 [Terracidiphilus sp.]
MPLSFAPFPAQDRAADRIENAHRTFGPPRALAFWHLASLDAPTVAVVWSLAFAWVGGVHLPPWVPLLLALATWSVYVCDRLLDGLAWLREPAQHALRERHRFHWRYRRTLLPMAIAAACAAAGIILAFMPPITRARDSVLAAAALAYFSGVHSGRNAWQFPLQGPRSFPGKEFLVGVLFTAGCVLPAWHRPHAFAAPGSTIWAFWIPAVFFAALAWLNCSCIAGWESMDEPWEARSGSAKHVLSDQRPKPPATFYVSVLLACGGLFSAAVGASAHPRPAALLAAGATSASLLALLDRTRARFSALALRAAADFVLLTPLALIPVAGLLR